jgi:hypothetical protein
MRLHNPQTVAQICHFAGKSKETNVISLCLTLEKLNFTVEVQEFTYMRFISVTFVP